MKYIESILWLISLVVFIIAAYQAIKYALKKLNLL